MISAKFKTVDAVEVVELTYPDGKVVAYPANAHAGVAVAPGQGRRYSEIYAAEYAAFKNEVRATGERPAETARAEPPKRNEVAVRDDAAPAAPAADTKKKRKKK